MAIDTIRVLSESAAHLWNRLQSYGSLERLLVCECFEDWREPEVPPTTVSVTHPATVVPATASFDEALIRRDYRRLRELLLELEMLVRSRERTMELVLANVHEQIEPISLPTSS